MSKNKETSASRFASLVGELEKRDSFHVDAAKLELSEQIYQMMESKSVTEAELSRRLAVSRAYVNKILQGNVNFTVETLVKIGRALDCSFEFGFVDNNPKMSVLDSEIIYEQIAKPIPSRHTHNQRINIFDFQKYKLNKTKNVSIMDAEIVLSRKSEENYAPRENAA